MLEQDRNLSRVLMMTGIFRLDRGRWPGSAAELKLFIERKGWNLDLSPYHTLTFQSGERRGLVLEFSRYLPEGDRVARGRVEVEPDFFEENGGQGLPLRVRFEPLPAVGVELRNCCPAKTA